MCYICACVYVHAVDSAIMDGSTQPGSCSGKPLHVNYKTENEGYK